MDPAYYMQRNVSYKVEGGRVGAGLFIKFRPDNDSLITAAPDKATFVSRRDKRRGTSPSKSPRFLLENAT